MAGETCNPGQIFALVQADYETQSAAGEGESCDVSCAEENEQCNVGPTFALIPGDYPTETAASGNYCIGVCDEESEECVGLKLFDVDARIYRELKRALEDRLVIVSSISGFYGSNVVLVEVSETIGVSASIITAGTEYKLFTLSDEVGFGGRLDGVYFLAVVPTSNQTEDLGLESDVSGDYDLVVVSTPDQAETLQLEDNLSGTYAIVIIEAPDQSEDLALSSSLSGTETLVIIEAPSHYDDLGLISAISGVYA